MNILDVNNLKKSYTMGVNKTYALNGVSFSVTPGEFIVLCGPSGSGKSSLLSILGAMDEPSEGTVKIAGTSLSGLTDRAKSRLRRDHLGFIFQSFNLIPVLTALENVAYPISLQRSQDRSTRALEALKQVGLEKFANHRPTQLSGGQIQRVAIARALVTKPDMILADEPTANLDSVTSDQIIDLMYELNSSSGITFILASHDQKIINSSKRVIALRDGIIEKDCEIIMAA